MKSIKSDESRNIPVNLEVNLISFVYLRTELNR